MIMIDFSSIAVTTVAGHFRREKEQPSVSVVRALVCKRINDIKKQFHKDRGKYGMVLVFDNKNYWRTDIFPHYKANRKKSRAKSTMDWNMYYQSCQIIKSELEREAKFHCIEIEKCEADDIIYIICNELKETDEPIVIVSKDKDLVQIQKINSNVSQWSTQTNSFIDTSSINLPLVQHVIGGDDGDGVPNIFSDEDTLVSPDKRQTPYAKKKKERLYHLTNYTDIIEELTPEELERFKLNRKLIDMAYIPDNYVDECLCEFKSRDTKIRESFYNYLVSHRLSYLAG